MHSKLTVLLTLIGLSVILALAVKYLASSSTPLVVVEGNSMLPTLHNGDLVLIYKPGPGDIKPGDIIVYRSPSQNKLVIHRVIEVNRCGPQYCYITKGDNNVNADNSPILQLEPPQGIDYDDILGVVMGVRIRGVCVPFRIPYLGILTMLLRG